MEQKDKAMRGARRKLLGLLLMVSALLFSRSETVYYGSHMFPHSLAEAMCDITGLAVLMAGWGLVMTKGREDGAGQ